MTVEIYHASTDNGPCTHLECIMSTTGYLLNVDTGATIELLNQWGELEDWTTETIVVPTAGNYKFVFIRSGLS